MRDNVRSAAAAKRGEKPAGRRGSQPLPRCRLATPALFGLFALLAPSTAGASPAPPRYAYVQQRLVVYKTPDADVRAGRLRWRELGPRGRPRGAWKKRAVKLTQDRPEASVSTRRKSYAHEVELVLGKERWRMLASRGAWYALPRRSGNRVDVVKPWRRSMRRSAGAYATGDVVLAAGARARFARASYGIAMVVGRTMGPERSYGISLRGLGSIVLVASGSARSVVLTLSERLGNKRFRYWDYPLLLTAKRRRYEIPLARFVRRGRRASRGSPRSLFAVEFRLLQDQGVTTFEIEHLGLHRDEMRVTGARPSRKKTTRVRWRAPRRQSAIVHWRDATGRTRSRPARRHARLPADALRYWVCASSAASQDSAERCDPPDAPLTTYATPAAPTTPLTVDNFSYAGPVSNARRPTMVFARTTKLERGLDARRREGTLAISYTPRAVNDYAGYFSPLPASLPKAPRVLELTLRAPVPPSHLEVGLRDHRLLEPKLNMGDFVGKLGPRWQTIRIPFAAFAARAATHGAKASFGRPGGVSVAIKVPPGARGATSRLLGKRLTLQLQSIRIVHAVEPMPLARFDGNDPRRTSVGDIVLQRSKNATVIANTRAKGRSGFGLQVTVRNMKRGGFALVFLGLGKLDLRRYKRLTFWVKGARGDEKFRIYLHDRKRQKKGAFVRSETYGRVRTRWRKMSIPLSAFRGVRLRALRAVMLMWETPPLDTDRLTFDDFEVE